MKRRVAAVPVLYGDGVHDDARALEVAMNGGRVNWSDGKPVGSVISGKRFLCGSMVTVRGELKRSVIDNVFTVTEEHRQRLEQGSQSAVTHVDRMNRQMVVRPSSIGAVIGISNGGRLVHFTLTKAAWESVKKSTDRIMRRQLTARLK